jgi:hypothetical protein
MTTRWQGLAALIQETVHHAALAVERVHQEVARAPLDLVARLPPLASGARCVAECQEAVIGATYAAVRGVNGAVGALAIAALGAVPGDRS